jgi:hypothetical protein
MDVRGGPTVHLRCVADAGQHERFKVPAIFLSQDGSLQERMGSPCPHEGSKRPIPEARWDFSKGMLTRAAERLHINRRPLNSRSSPTQLSRQSKNGGPRLVGLADSANVWRECQCTQCKSEQR